MLDVFVGQVDSDDIECARQLSRDRDARPAADIEHSGAFRQPVDQKLESGRGRTAASGLVGCGAAVIAVFHDPLVVDGWIVRRPQWITPTSAEFIAIRPKSLMSGGAGATCSSSFLV